MEQKTETLDQSVIDKLKSIQEEQNNMVIALGQVAVRRREIEKQITDLDSKEDEENLENQFKNKPPKIPATFMTKAEIKK